MKVTKCELRSVVAISSLVAITSCVGRWPMSAAAPDSPERDRRGCRQAESRCVPICRSKSVSRRRFPGMIAIELTGGSVLYATADGRYLIAGDLYEMGDSLVNLAEQARDEKRKELIAGVSTNDMACFRRKANAKPSSPFSPTSIARLPQAASRSAADEQDGRRGAIPRVSARRRRFARLRQDSSRRGVPTIGRTRSRA